jgi:hypothetical protein
MSFGLKNVVANFQCAMSYLFHDPVHIILAYLNYLTNHLNKYLKHLEDLRTIFLRCHKYNTFLNPFTFVVYVPIDQLLGSIVSNVDITIDPLKFQSIIELPSLHNFHTREIQFLVLVDLRLHHNFSWVSFVATFKHTLCTE